MFYSTLCPSPLGPLTLACDGEGRALVGLWFQGQRYFGGSLPQPPEVRDDLPVFRAARLWLERYFAGERPPVADLPLAPMGTPFRQAVWAALGRVPYGQVTTYGQLAHALGAGEAAGAWSRAVGGAVAHNPISILIPCHRVVGADGRLTGYAAGLDKKLWLLRHESAPLPPPPAGRAP